MRYLISSDTVAIENFSRAAEELHLSQPGVSRQLKLLEDELGFELFVRDGRALVKLTAAGQRVHGGSDFQVWRFYTRFAPDSRLLSTGDGRQTGGQGTPPSLSRCTPM